MTRRLTYLRVVTVGGYICGILLSRTLWFGTGRSIPRLPLVAGTPDSFWIAEIPLSVLLCTALLLCLFSARSRYLVSAAVITALLVLFDLTRLQPWVYQYALTLTTLAFAKTRQNNEALNEPIVIANQLIVASLYFWSGIQKLNWTFAHEVFPGLFENAGIHLNSSLLPRLAIAIALVEALTGVGLLIPKTRRIAVVLAVVLHLSVLVLLVLARANTVVWPWNVAMLIIVPILFWRFERSVKVANYLPKTIIVLCTIGPVFSFVGWWDLNLSAALYAGNAPVAVVRVNDQVLAHLSDAAREQVFASSRGEILLPLHEWSMRELNVPPYPEVRTYRQLSRKLCTLSNNSEDVELIVRSRPQITNSSYTVSREDCVALLK